MIRSVNVTTGEVTVNEADAPASQTAQEALTSWREQARVSRFQFRTALQEWPAGNLAPAARTAAQTEAGRVGRLWDDADQFRRMSPHVRGLLNAIGLSPQDMDALFIAAAEIEA